MSCGRTIMFIGVALGLLGKSELLSAGESVERIVCEGVACGEETLSFEISYSVCAALIPGYEADNTRTGSMTTLGSTKALSSFFVIMSADAAADVGFPTRRIEDEYGLAIGTARVVNGQVLINEEVLGQRGRDYLRRLCKRFEATKA